MIIERNSCSKVDDVQSDPEGVKSCRRSGDTGVGMGEACGLVEKKLCMLCLDKNGQQYNFLPHHMFCNGPQRTIKHEASAKLYCLLQSLFAVPIPHQCYHIGMAVCGGVLNQ